MKFDDALRGEDSILLDPPNGERVVLGEWHRGIVGLVVCTGNIETDGKTIEDLQILKCENPSPEQSCSSSATCWLPCGSQTAPSAHGFTTTL